MVPRQAFLVFAAVMLLFTPPAAHSDDLDDLKATFEQEVKAFNSRDFSTFVATAHEQVVLFGHFPPFELEGIEAYRQRYQTLFSNNQSVTFAPLTPQFRVIGNVGVAWGHDKLVLKPKDGPSVTYSGRYTFVYTKADGKWLRVVVHASPEPTPPTTP